jgi:hypothetical protein
MNQQVATSTAATSRWTGPRAGAAVPFDAITAAGAYVCNWSGHLLRVSQCGLLPSGPLAVNIVGGEPLTVTKICDNPDVALSEARGLAQSYGLSVGF